MTAARLAQINSDRGPSVIRTPHTAVRGTALWQGRRGCARGPGRGRAAKQTRRVGVRGLDCPHTLAAPRDSRSRLLRGRRPQSAIQTRTLPFPARPHYSARPRYQLPSTQPPPRPRPPARAPCLPRSGSPSSPQGTCVRGSVVQPIEARRSLYTCSLPRKTRPS